MNMIEKVARALMANCKCCTVDTGGWATTVHAEEAKIAIETMREPTEEMIHQKGTFYSIKEQYQAMINAALKE